MTAVTTQVTCPGALLNETYFIRGNLIPKPGLRETEVNGGSDLGYPPFVSHFPIKCGKLFWQK